MKKKPTKKQKPTEQRREVDPELARLRKETMGMGTSQRPSDSAFELDWHESDPAWAWLDAFDALHENKWQDLAPLLALVPVNARIFVKDYFEVFLLAPKPGTKTPLWRAPLIDRVTRSMDQRMDDEGLTLKEAAVQVCKTWKQFTPDQLKEYHNSGRGDAQRWKARFIAACSSKISYRPPNKNKKRPQ